MARTPFFGELTRAMRLARASLHSDLTPGELVALSREQRAVSRRRFVGTSALALGAVALGGWAPPRRRWDGRPVLVVGAGIAGLTCAYRLRQAGVPVRVMEAQERIGGRMLSLRGFFPDGQVCELGGELIDTGHERIRALAAELEIPLDDLAADDPAVSRDLWHFGGERRSDAEVVAAFRPLARRIERDLATLGDADVTYRTALPAARRLDRTTLAEWLDGAGASGWMRRLLEVGYTTEFGLEPDRQSALNLLTMIGTEPDEFVIFGESDERFHVRGGNDRIPHALAGRMEDAIRTGTVLERVGRLADGGYRCTFRRGAATEEVDADQVVLALPFTLLRDVHLDLPLPEVKRRAITELGYGTNAKLMVGFGERVWRTRHGSNGSTLTDLPYQLSWETSRLQEGRAGIITNFTGGDHGARLMARTAADRAAELGAQMDAVFPGAAAARLPGREAMFHWPSHPWTRGSYASYRTGQWTALRGAEGEPVERLFFAGEHCSMEAQGFMEGGCETGERAAREVLASLGARLPVPALSAG